jgi:hypothetical protein
MRMLALAAVSFYVALTALTHVALTRVPSPVAASAAVVAQR